jgi:hypothetical protein
MSLDTGVATGEDERFMSIIAPSDQVGRLPVLTTHLEDLGDLLVLAHVVTLDDEPIAWSGVHVHLLFSSTSITPIQHCE